MAAKKATKRIGRPPGRKFTVGVALRLTDEEHRMIREVADSEALPVTITIRRLIRAAHRALTATTGRKAP